MRILIVASGNSYKISPFVKEQVNSLEKHGLAIDYFLIKGKGIVGYLKNYFLLRNKLTKNKSYDIIHAHYGLSGLLASMQKLVPVVITFHGSDVNLWHNYLYSWLASRLSARKVCEGPGFTRLSVLPSPPLESSIPTKDCAGITSLS